MSKDKEQQPKKPNGKDNNGKKGGYSRWLKTRHRVRKGMVR